MPFLDYEFHKAWNAQYRREQRALLRETRWDAEKYPNRKAWEKALLKCEQMRQRAIKHPHLVSRRAEDWDFEWQYMEALEEIAARAKQKKGSH